MSRTRIVMWSRTRLYSSAMPSSGGRALELQDVERPQLAGGADRPALAVLRVAGGEVGARQPGLEVLLRPPAGQDQADLAVVVGPQQLERLEALGARHLAGPVREPLRELVEAVARHGYRVDLDDAHAGIVCGRRLRTSTRRAPCPPCRARRPGRTAGRPACSARRAAPGPRAAGSSRGRVRTGRRRPPRSAIAPRPRSPAPTPGPPRRGARPAGRRAPSPRAARAPCRPPASLPGTGWLSAS